MAWRHYIRFYRQFYLMLILCAVASAGQSFILLPIALLIRRAFDDAIPAKNFYLLAVIGIVPMLLILNRAMSKSFRRHVKAFHESFENFSKGVLFLIQMIDLMRIQSAERFEIDRQRANTEDLHLRSSSMVRQQNLY